MLPDGSAERGISLVEVLLAMSILSGVLIALGSLMFQLAHQNRQSAGVGFRSAAVVSAASWAEGIPWDSIDGAIGCRADSSGSLAYARCTSVVTPSPRLKRLTVVISPTGQLVVAPETLVVQRTKPRSPSPFGVN